MKRFRWWRKPKNTFDEVDLERYFVTVREQEFQDSFPPVQGWLGRVQRNRQAEWQRSAMITNRMKNFLVTYRMRLALTSLILAVTIVSCTTPVEHEETIGHMISGTIDGGQAQTVTQQMSQLDWIQPSQLEMGLVTTPQRHPVHASETVQETEVEQPALDHQFLLALPETGERQAARWANEIRTIAGVKEVQVAPLRFASEKPIYKVVLHSLMENRDNFEYEVDAEKIDRAMAMYFEALEMHGVHVQKRIDSEGNQVLSLKPDANLEKDGLRTLKQFLGQTYVRQPQNEGTQKEQLESLRTKYADITDKLQYAEKGPGRDKLEKYQQDLKAKIDELARATEQRQ